MSNKSANVPSPFLAAISPPTPFLPLRNIIQPSLPRLSNRRRARRPHATIKLFRPTLTIRIGPIVVRISIRSALAGCEKRGSRALGHVLLGVVANRSIALILTCVAIKEKRDWCGDFSNVESLWRSLGSGFTVTARNHDPGT